MQFLGFGNGSDGAKTTSYAIPSATNYAACTGTATQNTLTSALSASAGDALFIHQSVHATTPGVWEVVYALSSNGSTVTLTTPLVNSYSTGAQVVKMPQLTGVTLTGADYIAPELGWNGTTGGIVPLLVNGVVSLNCNDLTGIYTNSGYRGGPSVNGTAWQAGGKPGRRGEGYDSAGYNAENSQQYAGGGGSGMDSYGSGGGGAGVSNGTNGTSETHGTGGTAFQTDVDLDTRLCFGAGGGSGSAYSSDSNSGISSSGWGGNGGGIIYIAARKIIITGTNKQINANAGTPGSGQMGSGDGAGGGGGASGGSIVIKTIELTAGNGTITATGTNGAAATGGRGYGGNGGNGVIRVEACVNFANTTSPTASTSFGGKNYCGTVAAILS